VAAEGKCDKALIELITFLMCPPKQYGCVPSAGLRPDCAGNITDRAPSGLRSIEMLATKNQATPR
jgi:hypothetical protein